MKAITLETADDAQPAPSEISSYTTPSELSSICEQLHALVIARCVRKRERHVPWTDGQRLQFNRHIDYLLKQVVVPPPGPNHDPGGHDNYRGSYKVVGRMDFEASYILNTKACTWILMTICSAARVASSGGATKHGNGNSTSNWKGTYYYRHAD